jgi:LysM repeat protein
MPSRSRLAMAALGATAVAAAPAAVMASVYVVRPGDTLGSIALRHGSSVRALAGANRLASQAVRVGQLLEIPDPSRSLPGYAVGGLDEDAHTVGPRDSLWVIARRYGVDPTALARWNGLNVNVTPAAGAVIQVPGRLVRVSALLGHAADGVGVDPALVRAVAWAESEWRQELVSPTGATGLMQLEPAAGQWVSNVLATRRLDLRSPGDNALAGALLLHHLLSLHAGDVGRAVAAYYQGDESIAQNGLFLDTARYQRTVRTLMEADPEA